MRNDGIFRCTMKCRVAPPGRTDPTVSRSRDKPNRARQRRKNSQNFACEEGQTLASGGRPATSQDNHKTVDSPSSIACWYRPRLARFFASKMVRIATTGSHRDAGRRTSAARRRVISLGRRSASKPTSPAPTKRPVELSRCALPVSAAFPATTSGTPRGV